MGELGANVVDDFLFGASQLRQKATQGAEQLEQAVTAHLAMQALLLGVGVYIAIILTKKFK